MKSILGIIEALFVWDPIQRDGFRHLTGYKKYLVAKDMNGELICLLYNNDESKQIIEKYIKNNKLDETLFKFEVTTMSKKEFELVMDYKIVILDGDLVLYKDVKEKAEICDIDNFTGDLPKDELNIYKVKK